MTLHKAALAGGTLCIALVAVLLGARQSSSPATEVRTQVQAVAAIADGPTTLDGAAKVAAEIPNLHSLLVSWRGELILERYSNLVVVMTSASDVSEARGRNLRNAYDLMEGFVIPPIALRK